MSDVLSSLVQRMIKIFLFLIGKDPLRIAKKYRKKGMEIGKNTYIYPDVVFGRGGKDPIIIGRNCVLTGCTILGHDASTNRQLKMKSSIR